MPLPLVKYSLGDVFIVPLLNGHFGCAITIAKDAKPFRQVSNVMFYGLNAIFSREPRIQSLAQISMESVICYSRSSDKLVQQGLWKRMGSLPGFNPCDWPLLPDLSRRGVVSVVVPNDVLSTKVFRNVTLDPNIVSELHCPNIISSPECMPESIMHAARVIYDPFYDDFVLRPKTGTAQLYQKYFGPSGRPRRSIK